MNIRDIIILGILLVSLPFCFTRPFYGMVLWTIVAFLNPHRYAWGEARNFPVAQAIAIPTLLGVLVFTRRWSFFFSKSVLPFFLLWAWFTVTTIVSTNTPLFIPHAADTWMRWEGVSKIILMTIILIGVVQDWRHLRWFMLAVAGGFGVFVAKLVPWMILSGGTSRVYGPDNTMLADNNDLGLALNMTLPIFFFLARTEEKPWVKRLMACLFIITIPAIFLTYSRGALLGFAVIAVLMVLRMRQRLLLIPVFGMVIVFGALFMPQAWRDRMAFFQEGTLDSSALGRINAWRFAWSLASEYPLTGGGFETFTPQLFQRYAQNPNDVHGPHSVYFGLLGDHGFAGLFLYLLLVGFCFLRLHKIIRYARNLDDDRAADYASMLQLSLIGFLVSGAFLGRAYFDYFFTIAACTVILKNVCEIEWADMLGGESTREVAA